LAGRASQSAAEAAAVKHSVTESEIRSRLDTASIPGFSIGLLNRCSSIVSTTKGEHAPTDAPPVMEDMIPPS
jgi:hypothetical protein